MARFGLVAVLKISAIFLQYLLLRVISSCFLTQNENEIRVSVHSNTYPHKKVKLYSIEKTANFCFTAYFFGQNRIKTHIDFWVAL